MSPLFICFSSKHDFVCFLSGMFAISTDHASDPDLDRHEHGWMTYGTNAVYLAWLGFSDIHSEIDHYIVTVGSTYMALDLTKVSTSRMQHLFVCLYTLSKKISQP